METLLTIEPVWAAFVAGLAVGSAVTIWIIGMCIYGKDDDVPIKTSN
jgi:hypothetical protein